MEMTTTQVFAVRAVTLFKKASAVTPSATMDKFAFLKNLMRNKWFKILVVLSW
ncbi:MAG: hypothetical protein MZV70_60035 [Desulfobacterales bacterium]|nr:hypothetical protein [Desulfobacterales bacterium]